MGYIVRRLNIFSYCILPAGKRVASFGGIRPFRHVISLYKTEKLLFGKGEFALKTNLI
jgi:hypothetical protein